LGFPVTQDGAVADAEVEDATGFLLLDTLLGKPREHGRTLPGVPVDLGVEPVGEDAREVAEDAATRDVCERTDIEARAEGADVVQVEAGGREEEIGIEAVVAHEAPDE
jgi:hypothetical protein